MHVARMLSVTLGIVGVLSVLAWTSQASAVERLRLECQGGKGFSAEATFEWSKDGQSMEETEVTLKCIENRRSPEVLIVRPADANDLEMTVTVSQGGQSNTCEIEDEIDEPEDLRKIIECRLNPDVRQPRAFFKLNR